MQDASSAIRPKGKSTLVDIAVTSGARSTGLKGFDQWRGRILLEVKERPVKNRANREIIDFFSKLFNTDVKIVSGAKSSQKTIMVSCSEEDVRRALYEGE
jgi:uncharacterized protein (TIGR00251 family)